jgi:hypothetical protein
VNQQAWRIGAGGHGIEVEHQRQMTAPKAMHRIGQSAFGAQGLELIHQRAVVAIAIQPDHDAVLLHPLAQLGFEGYGDRAEITH